MARPIWRRRSWSESFTYNLVKRLEQEEEQSSPAVEELNTYYQKYDARFFFRDI